MSNTEQMRKLINLYENVEKPINEIFGWGNKQRERETEDSLIKTKVIRDNLRKAVGPELTQKLVSMGFRNDDSDHTYGIVFRMEVEEPVYCEVMLGVTFDGYEIGNKYDVNYLIYAHDTGGPYEGNAREFKKDIKGLDVNGVRTHLVNFIEKDIPALMKKIENFKKAMDDLHSEHPNHEYGEEGGE